MKILTETDDLAGKTIKYAKRVDCDSALALVFTDDSYTIVESVNIYDMVEVELADCVEDYVKMEAGVMTKKEYNELERIKIQRMRKETTERELRQLQQLQQKYPEVVK